MGSKGSKAKSSQFQDEFGVAAGGTKGGVVEGADYKSATYGREPKAVDYYDRPAYNK